MKRIITVAALFLIAFTASAQAQLLGTYKVGGEDKSVLYNQQKKTVYIETYDDKHNSVISIDFPGIGRYDIESDLLNLSTYDTMYHYGGGYGKLEDVIINSDDRLIKDSYWNPFSDSVEFIVDPVDYDMLFYRLADLYIGSVNKEFFKFISIINLTGNLYLLYLKVKDIEKVLDDARKSSGTTVTVGDIIPELGLKDDIKNNTTQDFCYANLLNFRKDIETSSYIFEQLRSSGTLKEKDYKLFPVHITDTEILGDNIL